jgi:hypothetical protein
VQPLNPNDFPDVEWDENDVEERMEIERGRVLFGQMVNLSQVLAEILETFYTLQASHAAANAGVQATQLILSLAKPIQLKLKEWYSGLPAVVRMDSNFQSSLHQPHRLSSIGYLHLAYFAAEITLHRRIIRSMDSAATAAAASSPSPAGTTLNGGAGGGGGGGGVDPYIQHICRSAAKARLISAMDFVNRLTPSHLRSFWYFASKTNFALIGTFGSLLWATSPGREEADWYRRRLGEYRWTLSVSSKPGEGRGLTEFAMGMLDISAGLLNKLPEKPLLSRSGSQVDVDAARRQSLLALGGTGGSGSRNGNGGGSGNGNGNGRGGLGMGMGMGVGGIGGFAVGSVGGGGSGSVSGLESYGGAHSAEASGGMSMGSEESDSEEEEEEEEVYGGFSATAGMAGMVD